jgi:hypothetical protein
MESLLRYIQAPPNPGEEPSCRLLIVRDKANSTTVSLFINKLLQPQDELNIEYGGPYWQIFWPHLSLDQQRRMKIQYPDVPASPWMWVKARSKLGALIRLRGDGAMSNEAKMGSFIFYTEKSTPPAHRTGLFRPTDNKQAAKKLLPKDDKENGSNTKRALSCAVVTSRRCCFSC